MIVKKIRYSMLISLYLSLAACATTTTENQYQEPNLTKGFATINNTYQKDSKNKSTSVIAIDNNKIGWHWVDQFKITPGLHKLTIYAAHVEAPNFLSFKQPESQKATVNISFTALSGEDYFLDSAVKGERIYVWVADKSGKLVSKKVSSEHSPVLSEEVHVKEMSR